MLFSSVVGSRSQGFQNDDWLTFRCSRTGEDDFQFPVWIDEGFLLRCLYCYYYSKTIDFAMLLFFLLIVIVVAIIRIITVTIIIGR